MRPRLVLALATGAALLGAVGLSGVLDDDGSRLDRARAQLSDPARFDSGIEAGDALAAVSELLLEEARACEARDPGAPRCAARASAAALAQGMAVRVLGCTAPGRFDARTSLHAHLDAVEAMDPAGPPPRLPRLPSC